VKNTHHLGERFIGQQIGMICDAAQKPASDFAL
jgi:hypothetical protein